MKKRTKEQKQRAEQKRIQMAQATYQYKDATASKGIASVPSLLVDQSSPLSNNHRVNYAKELFSFDVRLIYGDLRKTITLVIGLFVILGILTKFLSN